MNSNGPSNPREAYAVVSLRLLDVEIVVGVELRGGETAAAVYEVGRQAAVKAETWLSLEPQTPDEELASYVEGKLLRAHPDRAYYVEVGRHSESVPRPEYRYHVQLYKPWRGAEGKARGSFDPPNTLEASGVCGSVYGEGRLLSRCAREAGHHRKGAAIEACNTCSDGTWSWVHPDLLAEATRRDPR